MSLCISLQNHAPSQSVAHSALEGCGVGAALLRMVQIRDGEQHMVAFKLIICVLQRSCAVAGALLLESLSGGRVHTTVRWR